MDSLGQNLDLSKLTDKDKQELQQFVVNESQKARIQQCTFRILSISSPLASVLCGTSRILPSIAY